MSVTEKREGEQGSEREKGGRGKELVMIYVRLRASLSLSLLAINEAFVDLRGVSYCDADSPHFNAAYKYDKHI